jgi:hypothetical protein
MTIHQPLEPAGRRMTVILPVGVSLDLAVYARSERAAFVVATLIAAAAMGDRKATVRW